MTGPLVNLAMITLDCADPQASARFWSALLGLEVVVKEEEFVMLAGPGHTFGFGRVENYEPPAWPNENGSKQFHFDVAVDDLEVTEQRAVELGATVPTEQPGEFWRVLLDPAGHPFCLIGTENWSGYLASAKNP